MWATAECFVACIVQKHMKQMSNPPELRHTSAGWTQKCWVWSPPDLSSCHVIRVEFCFHLSALSHESENTSFMDLFGNFSSSAPISATSIYWKKWRGGTTSQMLSKRSSGSGRASSLTFQEVLVKVTNNLKGNVTSHFHRFSCVFQLIVHAPLMLSLDGVSTGKNKWDCFDNVITGILEFCCILWIIKNAFHLFCLYSPATPELNTTQCTSCSLAICLTAF